MSRARITVSVPQQIVEAADRRAAAEARSRSWIVSEAVAVYTGVEPPGSPTQGEGRSGTVTAGANSSGTATPGAAPPEVARPGLGPQRAQQLAADLELTPEQRVLEAELTARLALVREDRGRRSFIVTFERYDDYLHWKAREAAGLP